MGELPGLFLGSQMWASDDQTTMFIFINMLAVPKVKKMAQTVFSNNLLADVTENSRVIFRCGCIQVLRHCH